MDVLPIVIVGFLPLVLIPRGLRLACWSYIALIALYMYHKSMFAVADIAGRSLQWPTLTKDVTGLVLGLLLLFAIGIRQPTLLNQRQRRTLGIGVVFVVYWTMSSLVAGAGIGQIAIGLRPYAYYMLIAIAIAGVVLRESRDWERLGLILMITGMAVSIIALLEYYVEPTFLISDSFRAVWNGHLVPWLAFDDNGRAHGFFTTANTLGYFASVGILAALWIMGRASQSTATKAVAFVTIATSGWTLALTLSRSSVVAAALSAAVAALVVRPNRHVRLLGFLLIPAALVFFVGPLRDRFVGAMNNPRLLVWAGLIAATLRNHVTALIGHGVGSLGRFGADVATVSIHLPPSLAAAIGESGIVAADNFFVRTLYETGLLGSLFIVWVVVISLRLFRAVAAMSQEDRRTLSLPIGLMAFVLLISVFSDSLGTYPWNFLFWLCVSGIMVESNRNVAALPRLPRDL